ncbi:MAG: hypothetical protein KDH19_03370, partial [Geminicoccaceae bacterium]|nr:hypothetical protein [Geminicoccaceae bacterium]
LSKRFDESRRVTGGARFGSVREQKEAEGGSSFRGVHAIPRWRGTGVNLARISSRASELNITLKDWIEICITH